MLSSEFIRKYTEIQRTANPFEKHCYIYDESINFVEKAIYDGFKAKGMAQDDIQAVLKKEIETSNDEIIKKYELEIDFEALLAKMCG